MILPIWKSQNYVWWNGGTRGQGSLTRTNTVDKRDFNLTISVPARQPQDAMLAIQLAMSSLIFPLAINNV